MNTASHTMVARQVGHQAERAGLTVFIVGALVVALSLALGAFAHALNDTTHEAQ